MVSVLTDGSGRLPPQKSLSICERGAVKLGSVNENGVSQSWAKYLRNTLVLVGNRHCGRNLVSISQQFFASVSKIFISGKE